MENVQNQFHYYLRDHQNMPFACICIVQNDGIWSRGISICSIGEGIFNKQQAINKAVGRARKAMINKQSSDVILINGNRDDITVATLQKFISRASSELSFSIFGNNDKDVYKSAYNVELCDHEKRIAGLIKPE